MEDIIKSIKAFLYDRSSSPLFGAFIISWMAWNYRLLMLVLSDTEIDKKFKDIDKYFDPVVWEIGKYSFSIPTEILNGFIVPVIFALTFIFLYPHAAQPVYRYSLKKQSKIREIKQEENDLRLLDAKESRELLQWMAELQEKYNIDTEKLQRKVTDLSKTISELEKKSRPDFSDLTDEQLQEKIHGYTEDNEIDLIFDKINKNNWKNNYLKAIDTVHSAENGWIKQNEVDESFGYFIDLGLFDIIEHNGENIYLVISNLGNKVLRRARL